MSHLYGEELGCGARVGAFVVERLHHRGAMSSLYRAHDAAGLLAALKVLSSELTFSSGALRRFHREAALLHSLRHPSIVELREHGELTDGRPYLAMEWLEGRDLAQELAHGGPLAMPEALAVMEQVCAALEAVHRAGAVHRDLKAQNVMVRAQPSGRHVKLVDFGIARPLAEGPEAGLTTTGRSLGTPIAMAPEQIRCEEVDACADIYAAGVLLYQLLTGQLPFQAPTAQEVEELHLHAPPPRVSARAPVPPGVDAVVQRCLMKRREERFPDAATLLLELRRAAGVDMGPIAPAPPPARTAALYLEVSAGEDASDEALERVDALLEHAGQALCAARLEVVASGAGILLATSPLPASAGEARQAMTRLVQVATELELSLEALRGQAPLRVALALHAGAGEELLAPARWSEGHLGTGLAVTGAVLEAVPEGCRAEPVPGSALYRVRQATPRAAIRPAGP